MRCTDEDALFVCKKLFFLITVLVFRFLPSVSHTFETGQKLKSKRILAAPDWLGVADTCSLKRNLEQDVAAPSGRRTHAHKSLVIFYCQEETHIGHLPVPDPAARLRQKHLAQTSNIFRLCFTSA